MPELPEVETTCSGIRPHLLDQSVLKVEVRQARLRWPVSQEIEDLVQQKVISVKRRAKYIFIEFADGSIIAHLGMSGSLRITQEDEELKKHDHLIFTLSSGMQMRYHDPRRFGCMLWAENPLEHKLIQNLGPEPLEDTFHPDYFYAKAKTSNLSIKQFIMNNAVVVGVGNIYACESLFLSSISPKRVANSISKARLTKLCGNIKTTLARAITQGGTTLRDFVNQDGKPGYFQQELFVYNREHEECSKCGKKIKRIVQAQRSTFFCSTCQK